MCDKDWSRLSQRKCHITTACIYSVTEPHAEFSGEWNTVVMNTKCDAGLICERGVAVFVVVTPCCFLTES